MYGNVKFLPMIAATMMISCPAPAYHALPYASATVSGTQEKTLIHKLRPGHYTICVEWSTYDLQLTYDAHSTDIKAGDCVAVEASKISIKGKSEGEFSRAIIYDHTYRHHDRPGMPY